MGLRPRWLHLNDGAYSLACSERFRCSRRKPISIRPLSVTYVFFGKANVVAPFSRTASRSLIRAAMKFIEGDGDVDAVHYLDQSIRLAEIDKINGAHPRLSSATAPFLFPIATLR
ncbi:MAG: hypothetical protein KDG54_06495 [Geminicoccaceae bacterium]|nr:hypothetical protein [Geminicoccaceae bacterium]